MIKEETNTQNVDHSTRPRSLRGLTLLILISGLALSASSVALALDYAERTPGDRHLSEALEAYEAGQYPSAMSKFRRAAHWADKVAQYNLGVMYLNGQGIEPDVPRAWAWFELSAERRYPHMMDVADRLWEALDESQREQGRSIYEDELLNKYGDEVAVPRTASYMRREQRRSTGSRVGFRSSNLTVIEPEFMDPDPLNPASLNAYGRIYTGDEFYDPAKFNFYNVVATETQLFKALQAGEVRLGEFKLIEEGEGAEPTDPDKDEP